TSGFGMSTRTSSSGSTGGPSESSGTPAAGGGAAGGDRARPGNVRGGRGGAKQVATVERAGDRRERVVGIRELVRVGDAAEALGSGQKQPVVGPDVQPSLAVAEGERAAAAPHAGIDYGEMDAGRHERKR